MWLIYQISEIIIKLCLSRCFLAEEYDDFLNEFLTTADAVFDTPLIQFEDFSNHTAFALLNKFEGLD